MAVTIDRRLDTLVAEVPLDHRQRATGLDEPGGALVCLRSWCLGPIVRPFSLALVKAGNQTLVWKFCARTGSMDAPRQPLPE
jgi:hypothetical protein